LRGSSWRYRRGCSRGSFQNRRACPWTYQCMLRCVQPDHHMIMRDWPEKRSSCRSFPF
jgi:hypothetical protein